MYIPAPTAIVDRLGGGRGGVSLDSPTGSGLDSIPTGSRSILRGWDCLESFSVSLLDDIRVTLEWRGLTGGGMLSSPGMGHCDRRSIAGDFRGTIIDGIPLSWVGGGLALRWRPSVGVVGEGLRPSGRVELWEGVDIIMITEWDGTQWTLANLNSLVLIKNCKEVFRLENLENLFRLANLFRLVMHASQK